MYCIDCGTKLNENVRFCHNCGKEVIGNMEESVRLETQIPSNDSPDPELEELENNYQLTRLYIGEEKADFYFRKWEKGERSWNWAAFFLTSFWLGYRRMYKPVIFIHIFLFAVILITTLFDFNWDRFSSAIGIGLSVGLGMGGNQLYKNHVNKKVGQMLQRNQNIERLKDEARYYGGGSWKGFFVSLGIFTIYIVLSVIVILTASLVNSASETSGDNGSPLVTIDEEDSDSIGDLSEDDTTIEETITNLLYKNVEALEAEDIDEYMTMIYKDVDETLYNQTEELLLMSFSYYDLSYEMSDIEFISVSDDVVKVRVTQITELIDGDDFQDNETVILHTLKKQDGQWKFYSSEIEDIQYIGMDDLDDNGVEQPGAGFGTSEVVTLQAPDMFDFEVSEYVDMNGDGVEEIVALVGAPMDSNEYLNEYVEIQVVFEEGYLPIAVYAENAPTLYLYDIDQDGWKEIFYETGYRITTVEVYRFGSEGIEFYDLLDGAIEEFRPYEVTTTSGTYSFDGTYETSFANKAGEEYFQQSCLSCHAGSSAPPLDTIGAKYTADEIEEIILNGQGSMPPSNIPDDQARIIAEWLATLK